MGKVRHVIQVLTSAFLFAFQHIPVTNVAEDVLIFISPMLIPLTAYLFGLWWTRPYFSYQMEFLVFSERLMFGRVVAVAGFVVFLAACVQFLFQFLFQRKSAKIVTSGLYSVVRHPQYFGIIVASLGITIMCLQSRFGAGENVVVIWLIQVLGYVLLAVYEERRLMKEHEEEYQSYKQKVPFIFPVPAITKIPEPLVSLTVAFVVALLLTLAL